MKIKFFNAFANISLIAFSLLICFIIGESAVRIMNLIPEDNRSLMFSSPTFRLDDKGAVRYYDNSNIRTLAVYGNKIEYDVNFQTNNMGFIDSKDYNAKKTSNKKKYIAFVGDSFTAGYHGGGGPWVPKLRSFSKMKEAVIYNLGVSGTGFEHFHRILHSVKKELPVTDIVILAISDDFFRQFWYPYTDSSRIFFCLENDKISDCSKNSYIARIIKPGYSNKKILSIAKTIIKDRKKARNNEYDENMWKRIGKKSKLLTYIVRTVKSLFNLNSDQIQSSVNYSLKALKNIKKDYPNANITLIHLPEKEEVKKGEYSIPKLKERVENIGITYWPALSKLNWNEKMFFKNDSHPDEDGYNNIIKCVLDYFSATKKDMVSQNVVSESQTKKCNSYGLAIYDNSNSK